MLLEGVQFGHYQLLQLIGSGGMGEVYLAEDTRIHRQVAIKVVRTEVIPSPNTHATKEAARLFQREMKAIAMLDHPHILPLFDFGEESLNRTTLMYMVMPFRHEGSLADWLKQRSNSEMLTAEDVAHFLHQAADALQQVHNHQLIHQDVKPSNFLIRSRTGNSNLPDLLLADFGIAKFMTATATSSHGIRGTPGYMAPEQWDSQPVSATDQYALAVMVYQLLTEALPFQGSPGQLMRQHFTSQPRPPSTLNSHISSAIDAVILRALEKKPEDRFASISDFAQAFQQALQSQGDLHATLAISSTEALTGTNRILTLLGRRQVRASIPAGAQDGQMIRLEGQGEPYYDGGPSGALILTINIATTEEMVLLSDSQQDGFTNRSALEFASNTTAIVPPLPTSQMEEKSALRPYANGLSISQERGETPPASQMNALSESVSGPFSDRTEEPIPHRRDLSWTKKVLFTGLALLVIAGSVGLLYPAIMNQIATTQAQQQGTANAFATTQTQQQGTAKVFATANNNIYATASAQAGATATTITTTQGKILSQATSGIPVLTDPLSDNTSNNRWDVTSGTVDSACMFINGTYHAIEARAGFFQPCFAEATNFSNFAYQVNMMIDKGKEDGIIFRADSASNSFYMFRINMSGSYALDLYQNSKLTSTLTNGYSTAIITALKASNMLAVVAYKGTFYLFDNQQFLTRVTDSTLSSGKIGVAAINYTQPTEAEFSHAQVWNVTASPIATGTTTPTVGYNGQSNAQGITVCKSNQNAIGSVLVQIFGCRAPKSLAVGHKVPPLKVVSSSRTC